MEGSNYSNTIQMYEQRGTFSGIDTYSVTNYGNFDICSKLLDESKGRSINNCLDTNALLTQLYNTHITSDNVATARKEAAEETCEGIDFDSLSFGATHVPLEIATIIQSEPNKSNNKVIWDLRNNNLPEITQYCHQSWPFFIFILQKYNNYGMYFPTIPIFYSISEDTSTLWIVSALLIRIDLLWQRVNKCVLRKSNCRRWMLM